MMKGKVLDLEKHKAVTEKIAAPVLGVTPGTLANWRWQNRGPNFFRAGRGIRYPVAELLAFRNSTMVKPGR